MTMDLDASLLSIARFPVKGLTPQSLDAAQLTPDQPLPGDRRFALAHGSSAFDAAAPAFQKKAHFLTWIRNPPLASIECSFDETGTKITMTAPGKNPMGANLTNPAHHAAIEKYVTEVLGPEATRGSVKVAEAPGAWFADVPDPYLSIQNTATLAELGRKLGQTEPLDHRRLRANLVIGGFPAWAEMQWVGSQIEIGETVLAIEAVIGRCAATHVNPDTGIPDGNLVGTLNDVYGHNKCGVYARVVKGGTIRRGDRVGRIL